MIETSSSVPLVRTTCPVCHDTDAAPFLTVPDRFELQAGEPYHLVRCRKCSLIYLNPRPDESVSGRFYEHEAYTPFVSTAGKAGATARLYTHLRTLNNRWKRRLIEKYSGRQGRLLDVGCGTGEFLHEMQAAGWQVRGVERDARAAAYAVEALRLPVIRGDLDALPSPDESFDVITAWHVLEHLYEPHRAIVRMRDLLKKGGLLIIAVPNAASLDARVYGQNWIAYDTPRHVQHFTPRALRMMMEMHGFEKRSMRSLHLDALFNALMSAQLGAQRSGSSTAGKLLRLVQAGGVGLAALLAGVLSADMRNYVGSTLLTVWRK